MHPESLSTSTRRFYARHHVLLAAGAALTSALIGGALVIGESLRHTLRERHDLRLGQVGPVIELEERFFTEQLAESFTDAAGAPLLVLAGSLSRQDGTLRANRVRILGVDDRFWHLSPAGKAPPGWNADSIMVSPALATRIQSTTSDGVLLRVAKPDALPLDAAFSDDEGRTTTMRTTIAGIVTPEYFAHFATRDTPDLPLNVFVPLSLLQQRVEHPHQVNVMLAHRTANLHELTTRLHTAWKIEDVALQLEPMPDNHWQLSSKRIFFDPLLEEAITHHSNPDTTVRSYFVNALAHGERSTPYSFVSALEGDGPALPSSAVEPYPMAINTWLAEDLGVGPGGEISMRFFVMGPMRRLEEKSARFVIEKIISMEGFAADRTLMPDFPGFSDAEHCRDWDPAMPVNMDLIRDKDEKYWEQWKGTPKAFISAAVADRLWRSRYGSVTSMRFAPEERDALATRLRAGIHPDRIGLAWRDVRAAAESSVDQGMDFGGLFLGMSFFLVIAALTLPGMLLTLHLEERRKETGLLRAVGFRSRHIIWLRLRECLPVFLWGALAGIPLAMAYAFLLASLMNGGWGSVTGGLTLRTVYSAPSLVTGPLLAVLLFAALAALRIRAHTRRSIGSLIVQTDAPLHATPHRIRWMLLCVLLITTTASVGIFTSLSEGPPNPGLSFGAGILMLFSGLAVFRAALTPSPFSTPTRWTLTGLAFAQLSRNTTRGLTVAGLLATGIFMVAGAGAFRLTPAHDPSHQGPGGGFRWVMQTSQPIARDMNNPIERESLGLDTIKTDWNAVPFRVREGDEASCLNPGRAQQPTVWGVQPAQLADRFTFTHGNWDSLSAPLEHGEIPCVADLTTLQWALKTSVGGRTTLRAEDGSELILRVVGAIQASALQGAVIIHADDFQRVFPSTSGATLFFIDAPNEESLVPLIGRRLLESGPEFTPIPERLETFFAVQNTYIAIFQSLGGMGMMLGLFGLAIVTRRNLLERRTEIAVLRGMGFEPTKIRRLLALEHSWLLLGGTGLGLLAAIITLWPMRSSVSPHALVALLFAICLMCSIVIFTILRTISSFIAIPPAVALSSR